MPVTRGSNRVRKTVLTPAKYTKVTVATSRGKPASVVPNHVEEPDRAHSPIHASIDQQTELPISKPAPIQTIHPSSIPIAQPSPVHPHPRLPYPERPTSHPYPSNRTPSPSRTNSGLFVTDNDVRNLQPRSVPLEAGALSRSQSSARLPPGLQIALSPALRPVSPALKDVKLGPARIIPHDIKLARFEGLIPGAVEFELVLVFSNYQLDVKRIKGLPVIFLSPLARSLDGWCVPWDKGLGIVQWEKILAEARRDLTKFNEEGGWDRYLGKACGNVAFDRRRPEA